MSSERTPRYRYGMESLSSLILVPGGWAAELLSMVGSPYSSISSRPNMSNIVFLVIKIDYN
jgi:hypothetical protein